MSLYICYHDFSQPCIGPVHCISSEAMEEIGGGGGGALQPDSNCYFDNSYAQSSSTCVNVYKLWTVWCVINASYLAFDGHASHMHVNSVWPHYTCNNLVKNVHNSIDCLFIGNGNTVRYEWLAWWLVLLINCMISLTVQIMEFLLSPSSGSKIEITITQVQFHRPWYV